MPTSLSAIQPKLAKSISLLALAVLYLLPGLLFSYRSIQEPWTLFRLARANLSLTAGHIVRFAGETAAYRGEHIGGELLQTGLIRLTGLPLESLALLPLGALLLPALTFSIVRVISRSTWLAVWLSLFSAWYYPRLYSHYAVQTYVWTDALFLCFVLLFWLWLQRPSALLSLLMVIIFAAAFLHYQTTPLWMIAAVFSGVLLARWRRDLYPSGTRTPSWALPLVFLVIYMHFDTVFYGNFLGRLSQEPVHLLAANFSDKVLGPLLGAQAARLGEFAAAPLSPRLATWTTLLAILGLSIPVLAWVLWKFRWALRSRQASRLVEKKDDIFVWSLLLVFGVHALAYSIYGAVSLRLVDLLFPLLLPVVLGEFPNGRYIAHRLAPALAACAAVGCLSYIASLQPDILAGESGRVADLLSQDSRVLADANTFGSLLLNASQEGKRFELAWLDEEAYAAAAGQIQARWSSFDYLVTDSLGKPITSRGWVFYRPWKDHMQEIDANPQLDKIYTSSKLSVFQPAGRELPGSTFLPEANQSWNSSFWLEAARSGLAVLWLLFIPGAVLALVLLPKISLPQALTGFWPVFLALSVGLSLAMHTFAGYLVNFTILGLGWHQPLVTLLTCATLAYLASRRLSVPPSSTWLLLLTGTVFLASWSLGAVLVDRYRSASRGPGIEFFLTATGPPGEQISASVANASGQLHSCSLRLEMQDMPVQEYGPFYLSPGAIHRTQVELPGKTLVKRLSLILACDRQPPQILHLNPPPLPMSRTAQVLGKPDDYP